MLVGYVEENYPGKRIPLPLTDRLKAYLDQYFIVGGMPAVVSSWVNDGDIEKVDALLDWIIGTYENDFSRHASESLSKLTFIWDSVPMQLAKDNKKFVFGHARTGMRSRDLEDALRWLVNAGLVYTVKKIGKPEMPLAMFADGTYFKLYLADIGILRKRSGVPSDFVFSRDKRYETYRGAATENYILSELVAGKGGVPYYWRSDGKAEVDFVTQFGHDAVPIEAKAGSNKSRSLSEFINRYGPKAAVVTSPRNNKSDVVIHVPLYLFWKVRDIVTDRINAK
jgi:predicted AAA+ superfamily ATPase